MPRPNDVGVGVCVALLNADRRVLLLKRKGAHAEGLWALPGGWIERKDTNPLDTVRREALEEVGVSVTDADFAGFTSVDHKDIGVRCITLYYVSYPHQWHGVPTIKEPSKASEMTWEVVEDLLGWNDEDPHMDESTLFPNLLQGLTQILNLDSYGETFDDFGLR